MKKFPAGLFVFVLAMVSVFAFCGFAEAVIRITAGPMTADVPEGWSVSEGGGQILFTAPDRKGSLAVRVDSSNGSAAGELAQRLSEELKGSKPQETGYGYAFYFTNASGTDSESLVQGFEEQGVCTVFTVVGVIDVIESPSGEILTDALRAILSSLKWNWEVK